MKCTNIYSLAALFLVSAGLSAQVGINTPDPQVTLDVVGNGNSTTIKDGLLPPRVSKQQLAAKVSGTYSSAQAGSLVYITDAIAPSGVTPSASQVTQITTTGYHQFDGTEWKAVSPNAVNLYNSNGDLTGNRTVTQNANTLSFNGSAVNAFSVNNAAGTANIFSVDGTNNRVGVGTTAPNAKFHVVSDAVVANRYSLIDAAVGTNQYGILALRNTSALATGNYSLLTFTNNGPTVGGATWGVGSIRTGNTATNGTQEDFYIGNSNGGGLSERFRIASTTGNVGIGVSNPTRKLQVEGEAYFNAVATATSPKNAIDINIGQDGVGFGNRGDNFGIGMRSNSSSGGGYVSRINFGDTAASGANAVKYLSFSVGNALNELMYLTDGNSGRVGIGTIAPTRKLHVEGAPFFNAAATTNTTKNAIDINIGQDGLGYGNRVDNYGINIRSASSIGTGTVARINFGDVSTGTATGAKYLSFSVGTSSNELMYMSDNNANNGFVGIGTSAPTQRLHVIGNILASGTITPSDIRIKKDITDNGYGLNELLKLRTINYRYKDENLSKDKKVGFVAQEIKASMPELVTTANDEMKTLGVNYAEMTVVLTKAVQQQQEMIKAQQTQIDELKAKLDRIESKAKAKF